ncbi:hypothetical protein [Enterobacter hormaechei]|uniref:hypothetical protein n=2 Tax=Enterobacter hormaechei TaxID=158836 RepID=UPI00115C69F3|nr:hypothetical protein [Enterobacter hormaechei]
MNSKQSTSNGNDQNNSLDDLSTPLKDKIFNKVYFYILFSFLLFNWQELIILLKAKEDIYYTLAIIYTGKAGLGGIFIPAWLAHFGLPIITGLIASVFSPFVTAIVSGLTSDSFAKIRYGDKIADDRVIEMMTEARQNIAKKEREINGLEQLNLDLKKENDILTAKNNEMLSVRRELFFGVKAFIDCYDEKKGLNTEADVIAFLKEVEHTDFYKDDDIKIKGPKLMEDLKKFYLEGTQTKEKENEMVLTPFQALIRRLLHRP